MPVVRRTSSFLRLAAAVAALAVTVSCGGSGGGTEPIVPPTGGTVASVLVSPTPDTLVVNGTMQLSATPRDALGATLSGRTTTWSSDNGNVAAVSSTGVVTGVAEGTTSVVATVEGQIGRATIVVRSVAAAPVATVTVTGATDSLFIGGTRPLTATLKDAAGNTLSGRTVAWASSDANILTVDGNGVVTAKAGGSAVITATSETRTGSLRLSVRTTVDNDKPAIVSFAVSPSTVNVTGAPQSVTFTARLTDATSGIGLFIVVARSPVVSNGSGGTLQQTQQCPTYTMASGTVNDGTFTCTITIPKGAVPGDWTFDVFVTDQATSQLILSSTDLAARGFASKFTVTSATPDLTPPAFASLTVFPTTVDARTSAQTVTATARLTDANSGVAEFAFTLTAPGGVARSCNARTPSSGTANDGTYTCVITIPVGATNGDYAITVRATDAATFYQEYPANGSFPAGFPTKVTVTGR